MGHKNILMKGNNVLAGSDPLQCSLEILYYILIYYK